MKYIIALFLAVYVGIRAKSIGEAALVGALLGALLGLVAYL